MNTDSNYLKYTDFLKNRQFIRWQLLSDKKTNDYWEKYIENNPAHYEALQEAITYLRTIGLNKTHFEENEQILLLERIEKTIQQERRTKKRSILWYASASVAAVVFIVIGITQYIQLNTPIVTLDQELIIGELLNNEDIQLITSEESIFFKNNVEVTLNNKGTAEIIQSNRESSKVQITRDKPNSLIVPYGRRSTLLLADGSKIWLNSGSVLEFPAHFNSKKREIRLTSGEMYIEVAHDPKKPFYVHTPNFNVKVYGTKFNISNYSGSSQSVVLVEGCVSLQSEGHKEVFINPNDKAIYFDSGFFETKEVNVNQFISWKDGYFTFDKTPMTEVLQQIGRYYNLSFNFGNDTNLQKRTCTGKIYLSDNLDNVMTTVALLSSTHYVKQENKIFITSHTN